MSLILAREELHRAVSQEFRRGKKLGGRKRAARFLDVQVNEILKWGQRSDPDAAETPAFSLFIDFDVPGVELKGAETVDAPAVPDVGKLPGGADGSVAQLGVPLPPMVEGVTLPVDEETMKAGERLPEQKETSREKKTGTEDEVSGQPRETPKVNTDPDESASFGIAYSYGRRGPT